MNRSILKFLAIGLLLTSCNTDKQTSDNLTAPVVKISGSHHAEGSYLTRDHKGNLVLCWTEGEKDSKGIFLYYAISYDNGKTFSNPVKVTSSEGTRFHSESMNKIAFRKDGTIVAVFEKRTPTEKNPYAGAIFYSQSFDNGKSWSTPKYIHSDTAVETSRSFFDLSTLPNGEVGAIWLDGRLKLGKKGTSVFFATTNGKQGFTEDKQIGETICQCCRTDLYSDSLGIIHAVFRDIINDSIRDMVHCFSSDSGRTFSSPVRISADNWVIDGCPHTGPDLARNNKGLHFTWYTAGGVPGVYYCNSTDSGKTFHQRELVSNQARHPRIATSEENVVIVWDEMIPKDSVYYPGIGMQIRNSSGRKRYYLSEENKSAYFPQVMILNKDSAIVSWTQEENDNCSIAYRIIKLNDK